jgi:hypothetical protein
MPITGFVSCSLGVAVPSAFDFSTVAWVNAVIANGGTVSVSRKQLVDTMIRGLKSDGVWTKLDRLWIYAAENQPSALTDMVSLVLATTVNSPTFNVNSGYNANGATDFVNLNTNLSSYGGQFGTNAGHVSCWEDVDAGNNNAVLMGVSNNSQSTDQISILPRFTDANTYLRCNDATPNAGTASVSGQGHFIANRSGASLSQGYRNGSLLYSPNAAAGSIPNINMIILGINDTTSGFNSNAGSAGVVVPMSSIGANLSGTDATNFYTRLRTYMTAVGVP